MIVTHHWSFDQLKLANVANDRAVLQQLYNVPALFHISAETLGARLPAIRRHDAFFRPLHQRLWQHALVQFEWLSEDRRLQRTSFSDGTQLVANITAVPERVDGVSLPPQSVTAITGGRATAVFQV